MLKELEGKGSEVGGSGEGKHVSRWPGPVAASNVDACLKHCRLYLQLGWPSDPRTSRPAHKIGQTLRKILDNVASL